MGNIGSHVDLTSGWRGHQAKPAAAEAFQHPPRDEAAPQGFDGCASGGCAFEIKNCRAYGNRAYGIVDNVQGAVSYDYCHLYANNLATALTVDTSGTPGPVAGTNGVVHNIPAE